MEPLIGIEPDFILTVAAYRDWIAFAIRRHWSGSPVLMYIRTLRSSTFPLLVWLDSAVSNRPLRVRSRIHGKGRSYQLDFNRESKTKKGLSQNSLKELERQPLFQA